MQDPHDIYSKDERQQQFPRRIRGKTSWKHSEHSQPSSPQNASGPGTVPPPDPAKPLQQMNGWNDFEHRHHKRHHRSHPFRRIGWVLLLGGVLVGYMAVLGLSIYRDSKGVKEPPPSTKTNATAGASSPVATGETAVAQSPAPSPVIDEDIRLWERTYDFIEEAHQFSYEGHDNLAQERLEQALKFTPHMIDLHMALADVYTKQMKYAEAKDLLLQVLEANPVQDSARMMLATVYAAQTNHESALAMARWILETDPNSTKANQVAANAYLNTGRPGLAIPHLRKLVNMGQDNIVALNNMAVAYTRVGEYEKATQIFTEALQKNSANSVTYYNLAVCYAHQSMVEQAVEILARAASSFGQGFVGAWMQSKDFDTIRNSAQFINLQNQVNSTKEGNIETTAPPSLQIMESQEPETPKP